MSPDFAFFQDLLIALVLGLLVGLQRERADRDIAGIRTFPLITILGVFSGTLAQEFGGWIVAASLLALAAMIVVGNLIKAREGRADPGLTTEMAALVMFSVGAALVAGYTAPAITVGGGVALLLHWKRPLHEFARRIGPDDFQAIIRVVLVALVILPVLPNQAYGPYGVLNPFQMWLMVVLIVGISLSAFVVYKLMGPQSGTVAVGILGGLISSTATSVSHARHSREYPNDTDAAALVIFIASAIVFVRVIVEIAIVAPGILAVTVPPLATMMGIMVLIAGGAFMVTARRITAMSDRRPPSSLKAAIIFGLLYGVVLLAVAAAREHFDQRGLFVVAALSGLTDMDAITLSTAQLVRTGDLTAETGWRLILVGAMANLVFKGGVVAALGHPRLLGRVALLFALSLPGGALILAFWG
jgi:uncharacterized membrane protein (DUF4010 family)